jgi:hypothetical protein
MKFKNNLSHDVYVDLGGFVRVAPGEELIWRERPHAHR